MSIENYNSNHWPETRVSWKYLRMKVIVYLHDCLLPSFSDLNDPLVQGNRLHFNSMIHHPMSLFHDWLLKQYCSVLRLKQTPIIYSVTNFQNVKPSSWSYVGMRYMQTPHKQTVKSSEEYKSHISLCDVIEELCLVF